MKMRLALLGALMLLAVPVLAGNTLKYDPTLNEDGTQKADSLTGAALALPYNQRVLWMYDSPGQGDQFNANSVRNERFEMEHCFGGIVDKLREQGIGVDFAPTNLFTKKANQTNFLWQRLGTYYPVVFCVGFANDGTLTRDCFYNADSTTAHLIHLEASGTALATNKFSATHGVDSLQSKNTNSSLSGVMRSALTTYQNGDTLWFNVFATGGRNGPSLPSGVSSVVRLLHPINLSAGRGFTPDATDTLNYSMPASSDSTAAYHEWLGPAWRVYFTASGRCVDYIKAIAGSNYQNNFSVVPYAIAARYLNVKPIKIAMELDDITDLTTGQNRGSNAVWDSLYTEFTQTWNFKPTFDVNPLHAWQYIQGVNPTWEDAWTQGAGWTWMQNRGIPWVHHAHDSTAASPTSGLLGRFGGYTNGNGPLADSSGTFGTRRAFHRVYANRFNPGGSDNEKMYGIYQKLQYSDSLRRAYCPTCPLPPYLSFPGNYSIAGNWTKRTNVTNPSWGLPPNSRTGELGISGRGYRSNGDCPPDSEFLAIAKGLNIPSGGKLYLRAYEFGGNGAASELAFRAYGDGSVFLTSPGADRDSVIANSYFTIPDQEYVVKDATGYMVTVHAIGFAAMDQSTVEGLRASSSYTISQMLGFFNPVPQGSTYGMLDQTTTAGWNNESASVDPNNVGLPNSVNQRNFSGRYHNRMIYFHPRSTPLAQGPGGSYGIECARRGILMPVRALNALAGKTIIKWVYPWELYQ